MKMNIKKIIKRNPFLLAPMDDVTDIGFRELCEETEAAYSTSELTSCDALIRDKVYKSRYERSNLKINCVQLFGSNPDTFVKAAKYLDDEADIVDVNFGCPSATVTKNSAGSMLLKDPKNVGKIIEKLVKNIDKPITAKMRLGYNKTAYNEVAKEIEDAGASLITIHGRTAKQKYTGKANWEPIREVWERASIPIIGNGDISCEYDIDSRLGKYCDGLMIGRAAIGNPHIFKQFNYYFKKGEKLEFDKRKVQKEYFKKYIHKLEDKEFANINLKISRQAMWFMKGMEGAKELRKRIVHEREIDKIINSVDNF